MGLFGGSSSSSNVSNSNNRDNKVQGGSDNLGFQGVISDSTGVTVNMLDAGAVSKSIELAKSGIDSANLTTRTAVQASSSVMDGALSSLASAQHSAINAIQQQSDKFASTVENLKGNDVRTLVIVGMAVVGLGAAFIFKRG